MESAIEYIRCPNCRMVGVASLTHPDLCTECADYMNAMDRARPCFCDDTPTRASRALGCVVGLAISIVGWAAVILFTGWVLQKVGLL